MKVKCKCATRTATSFFGSSKTEPIPGLTMGKTYHCAAVPIVSNWFYYTDISQDDICFLVYNDAEQWAIYDPQLFEPK